MTNDTPPLPGMKGGTPGAGVAPSVAPPPAQHTREELTLPCILCDRPMHRALVLVTDAAGLAHEVAGWRCDCGMEFVEGQCGSGRSGATGSDRQ